MSFWEQYKALTSKKVCLQTNPCTKYICTIHCLFFWWAFYQTANSWEKLELIKDRAKTHPNIGYFLHYFTAVNCSIRSANWNVSPWILTSTEKQKSNGLCLEGAYKADSSFILIILETHDIKWCCFSLVTRKIACAWYAAPPTWEHWQE